MAWSCTESHSLRGEAGQNYRRRIIQSPARVRGHHGTGFLQAEHVTKSKQSQGRGLELALCLLEVTLG